MLRVATKRVVQQIARRQCVPAALAARTSVMLGTARSMASIGAMLDSIAYEIPLKEAIKYDKGKEKWTRSDVKLAADGLATGFLDLRLAPGDMILAWLPADSADLHVTQFAAAKAGLTLAVLPEIASRDAVERTLSETNAKAIIYTPTLGNRDNTEILKDVVPELAKYDDATGVPFHSIKFPNLKIMIHTGFDVIQGVENLKHIFLPLEPDQSPLPAVQAKVSDSTPLYLEVHDDGSMGNVMTHADVLKKGPWPIVNGVLSKVCIKVMQGPPIDQAA